MGKIILKGVDYSAPVGGGSGESTEQIKEISERVKILEVKVPFGFSTTSVGAYGYLDLEGNFHEFGSGEQSEFIEGITGEYSQTSEVLAFKDASTNVNMLYARGGVEINGSGTNVSIAAADGYIGAGQYNNTKYININNSTQIKVPANASEIELPFSFGIDADGNCGFKKPGADAVTPFKSGAEPLSIENKSSTVVEQTISPRVLQSSPYNNIKWKVGCIIPKNVNNIPPNVKWYKINSTNPTTGVNMITEGPTSEIVNIINKYFKDYASIKMGYTTFDGSVYSFYNFAAETYGNDGIPFIWLPDIKAIDMYFLQGYSVRLT